MNQGSLHDLLHNKKLRITYKQILKVAIAVAQGLHYLHSQHPFIVHKGDYSFKNRNFIELFNFTYFSVST